MIYVLAKTNKEMLFMDNQQKSKVRLGSLTNDFDRDGYRERRRLEMNRRFGLLLSKKRSLECELDTVNRSLNSLDQQIKHYEAYEQLSIHGN